MGCKKQFASVHLVESYLLNFIEGPPPNVLNRDSTVVDGPQTTNSLLLESTLPLSCGGCIEFWFVQGLEAFAMPRLLSFSYLSIMTQVIDV